MEQSSKLSRISFATATMATSLLLAKSMQAPRPLSTEKTIPDTLFSGPLTFGDFLVFFGAGAVGLSSLNALAALSGPPTYTGIFGQLGHYPEHLDRTFVTWNKKSASMLAFAAANSLIRLQAMRGLGTAFTFDLVKPDQLKTDGMYRYVQHPSYVSGTLSIIGNAWLFVRLNGGLGPFLPPWVLKHAKWVQWTMWVLCAAFVCAIVAVRVSEEEAMLQKSFGREWEEWHRRTARFVPFLW